MDLTPTDKLLAGYLAAVTVLIVARGPLVDGHAWLLVAHLLFAATLVALRRLPAEARFGRAAHTFYPLLLVTGLYAEIGVLNGALDLSAILRHDAVAQRWEQTLFGMQVAYEWIRRAPSAFWSGFLHVGYLAYYPMILLPAPILAARGDWRGARRTVFTTLLAFVPCYIVFLLYPVAGPNYAFPHPTGIAREVWSARLVYAALALGSSVGAAFPSSHVAAALATVAAAWREWRPLGAALVLPLALLVVAVVYCQMHYGVDALAGLAVGAVAALLAPRLWIVLSGRERPRISR